MRARRSASLMLALVGLGGVCACAVAAVVGFSFDPLATVPAVKLARDPGATAGATSNAPVGNALWAVPLSVLSATGDRPIFSPSRRPAGAARDRRATTSTETAAAASGTGGGSSRASAGRNGGWRIQKTRCFSRGGDEEVGPPRAGQRP